MIDFAEESLQAPSLPGICPTHGLTRYVAWAVVEGEAISTFCEICAELARSREDEAWERMSN
jgi:hypothetical protein